MRTHGFQPSDEELCDMIRNVDTNANGAIDFNEVNMVTCIQLKHIFSPFEGL